MEDHQASNSLSSKIAQTLNADAEKRAKRARDDQLAMAAANSHAAFDELIRQNDRCISGICSAMCRGMVEDAKQEARIRIWIALKNGRYSGGFLHAWVATVTVRSCTDLLRKRQPWTQVELQEEYATDYSVAISDSRLVVEAFLSRLPERHREVAIMLFQDASISEISTFFGVSVNTVYKIIIKIKVRYVIWSNAE